jgi:TonB dependent receptor
LVQLNWGTNFGSANRNLDLFTIADGFQLASTAENIDNIRPYVYSNVNFPNSVIWTLGISYDDYNEAGIIKVEKVNPKLAVQWRATDDLILRAARFEVVKPLLANNQTLEPTQIAGFNQLFDDINGTKSTISAVGLDWQGLDGLLVGAEASWRNLKVPIRQLVNDQVREFVVDEDEQLYSAYVHWLPLSEIALSAGLIYDHFEAQLSSLSTDLNVPDDLETISVPVGIRYFHPSGFFGTFSTTYVDQDVKRSPGNLAGLTNGHDEFFVLDASVGYRLPKRLGIVSLSVSNLLDEGFKFQDDSFREFQDRPSIGPYFPERMILGRVTLNW